jgi:LacI family transcriptional regulator
MEAVSALNYRPDKNARNLSTNRSGLLGLVVSSFSLGWFPQFLAGLDRTVTNSEFEILVKSTAGNRTWRQEDGKLTAVACGIIWCDPDNFPRSITAAIVTVVSKKMAQTSLS